MSIVEGIIREISYTLSSYCFESYNMPLVAAFLRLVLSVRDQKRLPQLFCTALNNNQTRIFSSRANRVSDKLSKQDL